MLTRLALSLSLALLCHGALADTDQTQTAAATTEAQAVEELAQDRAAYEAARDAMVEAVPSLLAFLRKELPSGKPSAGRSKG